MMLHRMKYLLKIPLLAISVACNRSAQEIKMIVLQSPQRSLFSRPLSPAPTHTPTPQTRQTFTASSSLHDNSPCLGVAAAVVLHPILITDTLNVSLENAPAGKLLIGWGGNQATGSSKKRRRLCLCSSFLPSCPGQE